MKKQSRTFIVKNHSGEIKNRVTLKFLRENNITYKCTNENSSGYPKDHTVTYFYGSEDSLNHLAYFFFWD